ncbi:unnamed protein product [Haemonchus placei]|uniref:PI3K/PI4K domain-containing protein n=1 Tax=Haemonchus placei TaxID=6290 RepID=A0A0N4VSF7_HAEPC|nr:unnamed protein product [Haemonchus placei]
MVCFLMGFDDSVNLRITAGIQEKGWRDDLSEKALQYLKSPDSVKADLITTDKESFKKTDPKPLWYRVFTMVSKLLEQKKEEVLPPILYGCNGVITKGEAEDVLSVACLYTFQ